MCLTQVRAKKLVFGIKTVKKLATMFDKNLDIGRMETTLKDFGLVPVWYCRFIFFPSNILIFYLQMTMSMNGLCGHVEKAGIKSLDSFHHLMLKCREMTSKNGLHIRKEKVCSYFRCWILCNI